MNIKIIEKQEDYITVRIPRSSHNKIFLETEEDIAQKVNEIGRILTKDALEQIDEKEKIITVNGEKAVFKKKEQKEYKTPYGSIIVIRNLYKMQNSGKLNCPIEEKSKTINTATPKLAKTITSKYVKMAGEEVIKDLEENHALNLTQSYIQNITYIVGKLSEKKENEIIYSVPTLEKEVETVAISMDGTCSFVGNNGWRETMVGTISLYDKEGNRLHTIYVAQAPEYGKTRFKECMIYEIEEIKKIVSPTVIFVGIADGAIDNWNFLKPFVEIEIVDFYHATEYLAKASKVANLNNVDAQKEWLESACHVLKHDNYAALAILEELKILDKKQRVPKKLKKDLASAITYFTNHHHQMNYADAIANNLPIGSGVTESACKVIVKQRLCISGARWSHWGANNLLKLRAINSTDGRWKQLWSKLVS